MLVFSTLLCELVPQALTLVSSPPSLSVNKYTVYMYIINVYSVLGGAVWGHSRGGGASDR
jgi:hypothetical protein